MGFVDAEKRNSRGGIDELLLLSQNDIVFRDGAS